MEELGVIPEGIDILKSESSGKLYVINELLNFYQRKLCILGKLQARNLAHHKFKLEEFEAALELLNSLWTWKKLTPSSSNEYIIKGIGNRRRAKKNVCRTMASDIINFLEVEDANLNVCFLTVNCEKIPSSVHEKEAMSSVYVMLHKTQEDYDILMAAVNNNDDIVEEQGRRMDAMREDMNKNFLMLANMIKGNLPDKSATVTVSPIVENAQEGSNARLLEGTINPEITSEPTLIDSAPSGPVDCHVNVSTSKEVNTEDACSELEEGEIIEDEDGVDSAWFKNDLVYRSALYIKQVRNWSDLGSDQELQQQQSQPQQQQRNEEQQQILQQQQKLQQRKRQQQQQRQMKNMPYEEMMSRSRPHMPAQPTQGRGQMNSPFLRKKQKRNIILDEGEGNIPFSATKEILQI